MSEPNRRQFLGDVSRTALATGATVSWFAGSGRSPACAGPQTHPSGVRWLTEVQQPPEAIPSYATKLSSLLDGRRGRITTAAAWEMRRAELDTAWRDALGSIDGALGDTDFDVLSEDRDAGARAS